MKSKSQVLAMGDASTSISTQSLQSSPVSPVSTISHVSSHEPLPATESSSTLGDNYTIIVKLPVMQYQFPPPKTQFILLVQAMGSIFSKASSVNNAREA